MGITWINVVSHKLMGDILWITEKFCGLLLQTEIHRIFFLVFLRFLYYRCKLHLESIVYFVFGLTDVTTIEVEQQLDLDV